MVIAETKYEKFILYNGPAINQTLCVNLCKPTTKEKIAYSPNQEMGYSTRLGFFHLPFEVFEAVTEGIEMYEEE